MSNPSLILSFECSSNRGSLSLTSLAGVPAVHRDFATDRRSNTSLILQTQAAMDEFAPKSVAGILVGLGPGSYSGIRVSIALAQSLALTWSVPVFGMSSFQACEPLQQPTLAIGDARRGEYFAVKLSPHSPPPPPEILPWNALQSLICQYHEQNYPVISFDIPTQFPAQREMIKQVVPNSQHLAKNWLASRDGAEFNTSSTSAHKLAIPLEPIYLRSPHITPPKIKKLI